MGYSRSRFVKFTVREDAAALCAGLREAMDYFGGVPRALSREDKGKVERFNGYLKGTFVVPLGVGKEPCRQAPGPPGKIGLSNQ